ncbi:unnamed protein product [Cuscuta europaea]|uniref:Glucuronosyltransferase PGSIP8 n=1 Tax=Cuscuta europaea TaxID=41803 RepID=A0A9P0ZCL7_CUSEU|nr:unnamed protein product [Cuscuta europaea]
MARLWWSVLIVWWILVSAYAACGGAAPLAGRVHGCAYATMLYMGTPRDYDFYIATRVMLRSLARLGTEADLVVIASMDVPLGWIHTLEQEDGARVVRVENLNNPYRVQDNFDRRFELSLNKLYAWSLVEYSRVVMLDADNLFLHKTDELFQCGHFCAVFINPCIFHTGLFVLQPSVEVFKEMVHELEAGRENPDGADQGLIGSYFPDLLDKPMFHPPSNGTKLEGQYRLPLGYQMDASYYYLKLRWDVPCGPNSVITFPGAPWLKPWYWWAWPVLPLGIQWHEQRRQTIGYDAEMPIVTIQAVMYLGIMAIARLARPCLFKFCYWPEDTKNIIVQTSLRLIVIGSILLSYIVPFFVIPSTIHPILGWTLYMFGVFSHLCVVITVFLVPMLTVLVPLFGFLGALLVMAYPWYPNGVVRALAVFAYSFCASPVVWGVFGRLFASHNVSLERGNGFLNRLQSESTTLSVFNKFH